ncbi:hypothetical protein ACTXT7_006863 [Hymenolepis weldensis]
MRRKRFEQHEFHASLNPFLKSSGRDWYQVRDSNSATLYVLANTFLAPEITKYFSLDTLLSLKEHFRRVYGYLGMSSANEAIKSWKYSVITTVVGNETNRDECEYGRKSTIAAKKQMRLITVMMMEAKIIPQLHHNCRLFRIVPKADTMVFPE